MIVIGTVKISLAKALKAELNALGMDSLIVSPKDKNFLDIIYSSDNDAIVLDIDFSNLPWFVNLDILNSIGSRCPLLLLRPNNAAFAAIESKLIDGVTITDYDLEDVLTNLGILGGPQRQSYKSFCKTMPIYNVQVPSEFLKKFGGVGIISVDASCFGKIGIEYGVDVYSQVKDVFQAILFETWGRKGSFRADDILCRKSISSNIYYVFLSSSRRTGGLPLPGALEALADRVTSSLQRSIYSELCAPHAKKRIPACVRSIPTPLVGYKGMIDNPCIQTEDIVNSGLEDARSVSLSQGKRLKERQLELMQTLIQGDDFLTPNYQAIFKLPDITREQVAMAQKINKVSPLKGSLFGFESLIRVNKERVQQITHLDGLRMTGLDFRFLNPEVLFGLAKITNVSLELDQACLVKAASHSNVLPGVLMVNILPRNLYYIDQLLGIFGDRRDVMFEVSESEAINNFELMKQSCKALSTRDFGIAANDFGKGFSSLERIIKIKPNVIKFDRSMIENIHQDSVKKAYVEGMVRAAKIIKTVVLAEGVELWEEAEVLQQIGIELVQGFLFHKPQSIENIMADLVIEEDSFGSAS